MLKTEAQLIIDLLIKYNKFEFIIAAEHDQIWFDFTEDDIPEDSDDGEKLKENGFFFDNGYWSMHV